MSGDASPPGRPGGSVGEANGGRSRRRPEGGAAVPDVEFVFDSRGHTVAVRIGRNLVDLDGCWLGSAPWNDGDTFDADGRYLGTITPEQRLYEIDARRGLTCPRPTASPSIRPPVAPGALPAEAPAPGMRDARIRRVDQPVGRPGPTDGYRSMDRS